MADQTYANRGAFEARRADDSLYCVGYFTELFLEPWRGTATWRDRRTKDVGEATNLPADGVFHCARNLLWIADLNEKLRVWLSTEENRLDDRVQPYIAAPVIAKPDSSVREPRIVTDRSGKASEIVIPTDVGDFTLRHAGTAYWQGRGLPASQQQTVEMPSIVVEEATESLTHLVNAFAWLSARAAT